MRRLVLVALAVVFTVPLTSEESQAQLLTLYASKLFTTDTNQSNGLAFDVGSSPEHLYIADNSAQMRVYRLDGIKDAGPIALPGGGSIQELGLHFVREDTSLGGVGVLAGTLLYFQGGSGGLNPTAVYAINKTTAAVLASEEPNTSYSNGNGCQPLNSRGTGLGYSTRLDLFLGLDPFCSAIALFSGSAVTGHFDSQVNLPGQNLGDVKEHPQTGNIWVGSPVSGSDLMLSEFTESGVLLREFEVLDVATDEKVQVSRLAFDATGMRLWLLASDGDVYETSTHAVSVPALGSSGEFVMVVALLLTVLYVGRRGLLPSTE
jgi:hypothetical protein